jgi:hypothetical protein
MKNAFTLLFLSLTCLFWGCVTPGGCDGIVARYTDERVKIDGRLDDAAWKEATVYRMQLSEDRQAEGRVLREVAAVQVAWDDGHFYLGVHFTDSDITADGDKDQMHHYNLGDVCELFLKPEHRENYLELYVTPRSKKTSFYIPHVNETRSGASSLEDFDCGLIVAAHVTAGTLNQRGDRDGSWTAEMAMPVKDLERLGEKVRAGVPWRILVSRYNYSRIFGQGDNEIEYSMMLALSRTNYHLVDEYARLHLVK